jgi:hypothetical protein
MAQRAISINFQAFIKPSNQAMCNSNLNGSLFIMVIASVRGKPGINAKSQAIRLRAGREITAKIDFVLSKRGGRT